MEDGLRNELCLFVYLFILPLKSHRDQEDLEKQILRLKQNSFNVPIGSLWYVRFLTDFGRLYMLCCVSVCKYWLAKT